MSDDQQPPATPEQTSELAKAYDPSAIEEKWARYWVAERLFDTPEASGPARATNLARSAFTMLLPPPNVTGRLHMGHMLDHTQMDILTRWHRMRGDRALWLPGTDHASIATHMMVERQLASEGVTRHQIGREAFLERAWAWKQQYGGAITTQMRRLGDSVDWSREYFTMDDDLSVAVTEAFVRLFEQGLIYRGTYIVNWDPVAQTAVSDLEVDSEERAGKLYHIRYLLVGSGASEAEANSIVIATTRPETLLGDVAVAVNPDDLRYQALIGRELHLPLTGRTIPIVADTWANPEFGTGAVKVTPAHDPNDYAIGQRHNLPSLTIMDKSARIDLPGAATGDNAEGRLARARYQGLDRFEARKLILADLEAAGALVAARDHPMAVPVSQRTGAVIEPRLSEQWFLAVNKEAGANKSIAQTAIDAVREGHIRFIPDGSQKTYFEWMTNIHDWCISRQLWWGHRIPAWYCDGCQAVTVARSAPAACTACGHTSLTQDPDALDTWFSSGLLPFTVFGWPSADGRPTRDLNAFYPTNVLVTGSDILFFWVARMIMLSTHFMLDVPVPDGAAGFKPRTLADAVPFREVYIHGLVRAADGQKMSKTKGNVLDPLDMIARFGTDALRFTLASMASPGTDIAFSEERTDGYRAFANKIWNSARFLFMQIDRAPGQGLDLHVTNAVRTEQPLVLPEGTPLESRWMVSRLSAVCAEVDQSLATYRFDEAANAVYQFFWGEFCDWYLELVKLRLNFEAGQVNVPGMLTLLILIEVFDAALRLLSPFMPFLTEEIWHALHTKLGTGDSQQKSIALTRFPQAADYPRDPDAESAIATLEELIITVRAIRKELGVPEKEAAPIAIFSNDLLVTRLALANADMLAKMARVAEVQVAPLPLTSAGARSTAQFDLQVIYERQIDVAAERERLTKDLAKYDKGLAAAERQLTNDAFMAKAPEHIVAGLRRQFTETKLLADKARAALDALPPV